MSEIVTVVVPVRDEEATVADALESLARQDIGAERLDVIVFDGGSTDATRRIAEGFATAAPWHSFAVLDNPKRTVPYALNAALDNAAGAWFTRVDGRTALSPEYLRECIACAQRRGPGHAAGGQLVALARSAVAESIAAAVTHPVGVGRGFRVRSTVETEVPHHPFALWRTREIRDHGGFAEHLARNQDDEFSMRAREHGARIWLTPAATVAYRPRERLRGLAAQYFQYGLWKAAVGRTEGRFPLRSLAPGVVTAGTSVALAAALTGRRRWPLALSITAYAAAGHRVAASRPAATWPLSSLALATVHTAYGAGLLLGTARPGLVEGAAGHGRLR